MPGATTATQRDFKSSRLTRATPNQQHYPSVPHRRFFGGHAYSRRARSHCRFRSRGTDSVNEYGMKWMGASTKRQCGRALGTHVYPDRAEQLDERMLVGGRRQRSIGRLARETCQVGPEDASWQLQLIQLHKRLKLAQLLGQLGVFLTWCSTPTSFSASASSRPNLDYNLIVTSQYSSTTLNQFSYRIQ